MIRKSYITIVLITLLIIAIIAVSNANIIKTNKTKTMEATVSTTIKEDNRENFEHKGVDKIEAKASTTKKSSKTSSTSVESNKKSKKTYTDDDLFYLAAAVCREAGGSSEEVQLLVANVVVNRVNSSFYPNTVYGVLTDYKQYGMMWKYGISFPDWADKNTKDKCYRVAKRILEGERVCPKNVLFQAEFKQGSGIYKQIGNIYFCYY